MNAITILWVLISTFHSQQNGFKEDQLLYPRVRNAYTEKETVIKSLLNEKEIIKPYIFIRLFKKDEILEVWGRDVSKNEYVLIKEYDFCSNSGDPGPKRMQGDYQIPEGFYHINRFNPASNFYLSLGINYPNESDRILGESGSLGGDIFIHGDCVTIGCVPITDNKIMEVYLMAVEAKNNGQVKIPVHIFPTRLAGKEYESLIKEYKDNESLLIFWASLKPGYDYFETHHILPQFSVSSNGNYTISN